MGKEILKIEVVWEKEYGMGNPCSVCTDGMYIRQYRFTVDLGDRKVNTDFVICDPCYELLKDKDAV